MKTKNQIQQLAVIKLAQLNQMLKEEMPIPVPVYFLQAIGWANSVAIQSSGRRGRPSARIEWPEFEFTCSRVANSTGLSKVTVYKKLHEALAGGKLEITRTIRGAAGRPQIVYRLRRGEVGVPIQSVA